MDNSTQGNLGISKKQKWKKRSKVIAVLKTSSFDNQQIYQYNTGQIQVMQNTRNSALVVNNRYADHARNHAAGQFKQGNQFQNVQQVGNYGYQPNTLFGQTQTCQGSGPSFVPSNVLVNLSTGNQHGIYSGMSGPLKTNFFNPHGNNSQNPTFVTQDINFHNKNNHSLTQCQQSHRPSLLQHNFSLSNEQGVNNTRNQSQSSMCVPQTGNLSDRLNFSSTHSQGQSFNFIPQNFTNRQSTRNQSQSSVYIPQRGNLSDQLNFSSTQGQRFNWLPQNFTNQQNTWNHSQSPVCVPQSGNLSDQLNCSSTYNQGQRFNFRPQNFTNQQSYNTCSVNPISQHKPWLQGGNKSSQTVTEKNSSSTLIISNLSDLSITENKTVSVKIEKATIKTQNLTTKQKQYLANEARQQCEADHEQNQSAEIITCDEVEDNETECGKLKKEKTSLEHSKMSQDMLKSRPVQDQGQKFCVDSNDMDQEKGKELITNLTSGNKKCIASNPPDSDGKIKDRNVLEETKVKKQHELYLASKSTTEFKLKGNTQSDKGNTQSDIGNTQSDIGNTQSDNGNKQSDKGNKQSDIGNKQSDKGNKQSNNGNKQSDKGNTQLDKDNKQSDKDNKQSDNGNKQLDKDNKQSDKGNKQSNNGNKQSDKDNKQSDIGNKQSDKGNKQSDKGNKQSDIYNNIPIKTYEIAKNIDALVSKISKENMKFLSANKDSFERKGKEHAQNNDNELANAKSVKSLEGSPLKIKGKACSESEQVECLFMDTQSEMVKEEAQYTSNKIVTVNTKSSEHLKGSFFKLNVHRSSQNTKIKHLYMGSQSEVERSHDSSCMGIQSEIERSHDSLCMGIQSEVERGHDSACMGSQSEIERNHDSSCLGTQIEVERIHDSSCMSAQSEVETSHDIKQDNLKPSTNSLSKSMQQSYKKESSMCIPKLSTACLTKTNDMIEISSDGRLKYVTEDTFKPEPKATQDVAQIIDIGSLPKSVEKLNKAGCDFPPQASAIQSFHRLPAKKNQKSDDKSEFVDNGTNKDKENRCETGSESDILGCVEISNSQESPKCDNCLVETVDGEALDEDNSDKMYPRHYDYYDNSQNVYTERRTIDPEYRGGYRNYENQGNDQFVHQERGRGFQGYYRGDRRGNSYNQNYYYDEYGSCPGDFRNMDEYREITGRRPIHGQRFYDQYQNENAQYDRRRDIDEAHFRRRPEMKKSYSCEGFQPKPGFKKAHSYDGSEHTKGPSSRVQENVRTKSNANRTHQSCDRQTGKAENRSKEQIDKLEINEKESPKNLNSNNKDVLKSEDKQNQITTASPPKAISGGKIYQSEQYFSGTGQPENNEKVKIPSRNQNKNSREVIKPENVDSKEIKSPYRNLKRHLSEKIPKCADERIGKEKSPVKRQESAPTPIVSLTSEQNDKMDFSSIKKALNEVKNKEDRCDKHKLNDETPGISPVQGKDSSPAPVTINWKSSSEENQNILNNTVQTHQRKTSVEKVKSSPRSRSSSGDSQGMLSPKSYPELKQRSAFHSVHIHIHEEQSNELSKTSLHENPLQPHDRKRHVSGDVKNNKQSISGSPSQNEDDLAWSKMTLHAESSLSDATEGPETNISLKSATSYREWRRLKAIHDATLQKDHERQRPCIELANTPEEYRRLLQMRKQEARERAKTSQSETDNENTKSADSDGETETVPLPELHNSQNSFQTIQDTEETRVSDDDIDLEDSDDDDLEAPSFLFSLEEASTRPIPGTPTKLSHFESPGPASPLLEPDLTDITKKSLLSSKFSLDQLVSEKIDKSEDQRELEDMHAKLEEGLKKGGFIKDTLEEPVETNEELLPEEQNVVKKLQIFDSLISEVHPGDIIFQPILYQSRFTASLTLQTCGFTPGASYIDKYLSTLQPKDYSLLLTSNIMKNTLETVSCLESVLRWLFLLMSVHKNQLVTQGCHKVLLEHLKRQVHFKQASQTWVPTIPDVLSVFCNYGCEVNTILPENLINPTDDISNGMVQEEINGNIDHGGSYNLRNLHLVLDIIGQALHASPRYSNRQLTELLVILCHIAMDKSHHSEILPHELQVCIKGILRCYHSNYWENNCNDLCHTLFKVTTHHHNRLYLVQIFPEDKRGSYIQRRLSYLFLQDMFDVGRDTDIKDFKIKCLHVYLPKLHTLVSTDVYQLASAIGYLNLAVGNSAIKVAEKEHLQYLSDQLKKISGDVKDSVRMLDRSWVKDMMVRVCSKWTLYLLSVGSKQRSIFAYAKKKSSVVKIKTVETTQEDMSSHSEDEDESKDVPQEDDHSKEDDKFSHISETSDTSEYKTMRTCTIKHEKNNVTNFSMEIKKGPVNEKTEPENIISRHECDSPMEVDLTLDEELPDLL